MVIGIFGESCTGKTTLANAIKEKLGGEVFSGKDYLRLSKNEGLAKLQFSRMLKDALSGENIIYVITEKEHITMLPEGAVRVLMKAELNTIKQRFAERFNGNLPAAVEAMLEKRHGCFDDEKCDIAAKSEEYEIDFICQQILDLRG